MRKLEYITFVCIFSALTFWGFSMKGSFGTRKEKSIYSFEYHGKPSALVREDTRWGPDRYYMLIDGKDKITGTLTSDDGKSISVYDRYKWIIPNGGYSVTDAE